MGGVMRLSIVRRASVGREAAARAATAEPSALSLLFALVWLLAASFVGLVASVPARADDGGAHAFLMREAARSTHASSVGSFFRSAPRVFSAAAQAPRAVKARNSAVSKAARAKIRRRRHALALARAEAAKRALAAETKVLEKTEAATAETAPTSAKLAHKAAAAAARPADAYLRDETLRRGDIVATRQGLKVFAGAAHFPYVASDFTPVSRARRLGKRAALIALDKTIRRSRPASTRVVRVASAVTTKPRRVIVGTTERATNVASVERRRRHGEGHASAAMAYAPGPSLGPAQKAIERAVSKARRHGRKTIRRGHAASTNGLRVASAVKARRSQDATRRKSTHASRVARTKIGVASTTRHLQRRRSHASVAMAYAAGPTLAPAQKSIERVAHRGSRQGFRASRHYRGASVAARARVQRTVFAYSLPPRPARRNLGRGFLQYLFE
ncbi:MAG: hypothetical protein H6871_10195 [Methylobacteriaceae bacterium]|nr:hypothetical protein [Methylobacteriaceae bacterium]